MRNSAPMSHQIIKDDYEMTFGYSENNFQIALVAFQKVAKKFESSLDFQKQLELRFVFGEPKNLIEFMKSQQNFRYSAKRNSITLVWEVVGVNFKRELRKEIVLEAVQMVDVQSLKLKASFLRKTLQTLRSGKSRQKKVDEKLKLQYEIGAEDNISPNKVELPQALQVAQVPQIPLATQVSTGINQFVKIQVEDIPVVIQSIEPQSQRKKKERCVKDQNKDEHIKNDLQSNNSKTHIHSNKSQSNKPQTKNVNSFPKKTKQISKNNSKKDAKKVKKSGSGSSSAKKTSKTAEQPDHNTVQIIEQYQTSMVDNKKRVDMPNGDYYIGGLKNRFFHGQGYYYSKEGGIYDGQWKNGLKDGQGKLIDQDNTVYEGEFKNGKKNGKGKEVYANKEWYQGEFVDDYKQGYGVYCYNNGDRCEGQWKNDLFHGKGRQIFNDGEGSYYEGTWFNDERHGPGILVNKNVQLKQNWKNGKLVSSVQYKQKGK